MKRTIQLLSWFSLLLLLSSGSGCIPHDLPAGPSLGRTAEPETSTTLPAGLEATATMVLAQVHNSGGDVHLQSTGQPPAEPVLWQPTDASDNESNDGGSQPLRFVFPTPGPAPVSAWRPPLYPTPWAPTPFDHFFFGRPIAADQVNWPLPDYRYGGVFFDNVVHTGVDIPVPTGTQVLAAAPGRVTWAGYGLYYQTEDLTDPYGLAVAIKHDFGYAGETLYTIYGHMSEVLVQRGARVEGGDVIGLVGETGKTTGPHLHFEVRMGKNNFFGSRNPELWMSPPQGWGILVGRVMNTAGEQLPQTSLNIHNEDTGQYWEAITYGEGSTNSDPYYRENLVIGDLPAGKYEIWIAYEGSVYDLDLTVQPGLVTYFTFRGRNKFSTDLPPAPAADFLPEPTPTLKHK